MPGIRQKRPYLRAVIVLCCSLALNAHAETFSAKVIAVMDGDTVMVLRQGGQKLKIRLANIDAPEVGHAGMGGVPPNSQKDQPYGKQARDSLLQMLGRKQEQIDSRAIDKYGRVIGLVSVDGLDVNQAQVKRGYAWAGEGWQQRRFASGQSEEQTSGVARAAGDSGQSYISLQGEARRAGVGLWAQEDPQPPWQWRKQHPSVPPVAQEHQIIQDEVAPVKPSDMQCGHKRHCAQMASCEEARFYLHSCGVRSLDSNGDGEPCERLCGKLQ
jgi:micrococcal nuclease